MLLVVLVSLEKVLGVVLSMMLSVVIGVVICAVLTLFFKSYWTRITKESFLVSKMKQFLISFYGEITVLLPRLLN